MMTGPGPSRARSVAYDRVWPRRGGSPVAGGSGGRVLVRRVPDPCPVRGSLPRFSVTECVAGQSASPRIGFRALTRDVTPIGDITSIVTTVVTSENASYAKSLESGVPSRGTYPSDQR